ncbi:MAG: hypothetical protein DRP29_05115 [Thermodesulfobacteriota bacterium]|nr:MAG: hypothetical protein DRP29_05115 [Thermodesulfobacteriota bacterium]
MKNKNFIFKLIFIINFFYFLLFWFSFGFSQEKINLNEATFKELKSLPGIGPKIAQRIIKFREKYGPFNSIEDLLKVKGIGKKKLEILKNYLTVEEIKNRNLLNKNYSSNDLKIYYYVDENGIIHYTHFPETVPKKYKSTLKKIR